MFFVSCLINFHSSLIVMNIHIRDIDHYRRIVDCLIIIIYKMLMLSNSNNHYNELIRHLIVSYRPG